MGEFWKVEENNEVEKGKIDRTLHGLAVYEKHVKNIFKHLTPDKSFGDTVKERFSTLFKGKEDELYRRVDEACSATYKDDKDMIKAISVALCDIANTFDLKELESNSVEAAREVNPECIHINRLISYFVGGNVDGNEVCLHVMHASTLSFAEKMGLIRGAFHELAFKLKDDPEFAKVDKVSGTSWIFKEHPGLVKTLGFTIDDSVPVKESEKRAFISKAAFIEKFLK